MSTYGQAMQYRLGDYRQGTQANCDAACSGCWKFIIRSEAIRTPQPRTLSRLSPYRTD